MFGHSEIHITGYTSPPIANIKHVEASSAYFSKYTGAASPVGDNPGEDTFLVGVNLPLIVLQKSLLVLKGTDDGQT